MEAEPSRSADGQRSERQELQQHVTAESSQGSCPPQQPQQPLNPRPVHRALGRLQHRQPRRTDLLLRLQQQQAIAWQHSENPGPSGGSFYSSASTSSLQSTPSTLGEPGASAPSQSSQEGTEGVSSSRKGEKKPQKPGKYVCSYCGRPCAKPSVLQKHIRSHTGERPFPCVPCGFSFKTKSNLYKHRKSHAHRIKAGLACSRDEPSLSGPEGSGVGEDPEEHSEGESTESEEETGQHAKSSSKEMTGQQRKGGKEGPGASEEIQRPEDSQAVKQRLALRLSERKRGPKPSPDDPPSSLSTSSSSVGPGSKGSTESGYFSGSGSTELSQVSPPSASAKTYAEIILGKYGRLGGQQRTPLQQHPHSSLSSSSVTEEKNIPFTVQKTQVIEHITKLITINEAVVDTSEIDSVKPRRSSLSRKSSMESPKFSAPKDPYTFDPKGEIPGPSGLRHLLNPEAEASGTQGLSSVPLLRSQSMPSSTSQGDPSTSGTNAPRGYRLCQSFDEQQAMVAEMRVGHAHRMLKRQPAIEVPLGAEVMLEEAGPITSSFSSARGTEQARQLQQQQKIHSLFECKECGAHFQCSDTYEAHRVVCPGKKALEQESRDVRKTCREDRPPMMMHYKFRALAMAVRKRRKEESLEEDPPSPGPMSTSGSSASHVLMSSRMEQNPVLSGSLQTEPKEQQQDRKGVSVIQHTSSFEKQESVSMESQEPDLRERQQTQKPEPKPSPTTSRLIRQPNIQVPEILVTVEPDADMPSVTSPVAAATSKEAEKMEEFQWPQRSQTLAQLPAEKLPPKKKRLRLAEVAHSSGESSFESVSLSRSPSQESSISHTSSLSASFEDTARLEPAVWAVGSQSSQMLMVPPVSHPHHHSHKEMRRSASEHTPSSPQQTEQSSENRSKSFDYGSLSPQQQSTSSWKEKRKCLLVKHATLGEPDPEEGTSSSQLYRAESSKCGTAHSILPPLCSAEGSPQFGLEEKGRALQRLQSHIFTPHPDLQPLKPRGPQTFPAGSQSQLFPVTSAVSEVLSTEVVHRALVQSHSGPAHLQMHPAQIHMAEQLGFPLHHLPAVVPLQFSSSTGVGESLCLPQRHITYVSSPSTTDSRSSIVSVSSDRVHQSLVIAPYHHPRPVIATCLAQLTPVVSLVVPVRLQTHIPTYAGAMYTTLSQILACTRSQTTISCTAMAIMGQAEREKLQRSYLKVPSPDIILPLSLSAELSSGSGEAYGPLGAGGSKRMLSPAASLELSTEAQRHLKRVKEEEEGEKHKEKEEEEEEQEVERTEGDKVKNKSNGRKLDLGKKEHSLRVEVVAVKVEGEQQKMPRKHNKEEREEEVKDVTEKTGQKNEAAPLVVEGLERLSLPSFPSLHTSTSVNWCYLNYVKPNPAAQRDPRNSVYSTWSISAHNPNLPGLSTKMVLSLLCSKQKHSTETYTMATAPQPAKHSSRAASSRSPHLSEVCATSPSTPTEVRDQQQQQQQEREEHKEKKEEEAPSTSKQGEPSRVRIFEGGYKSNEEYTYVRGRGRGKYICGECGIRCKKPSMLKKHIRTHTDVRPYICKHCNFAFKTKGNLTKHMKSKAHGKKCQAMGVSESSLDEPESEETETAGSDERVCGSEEQEEHQFSDEESEEDDDNDDNDDEDEESVSHDNPPSSCSSDTHLSTGGRSSCSRQSQQGTPDPEPSAGLSPSQEHSPRGVWLSRRAASPGSRRALYSQRGWKASPRAFSPSSESYSPSRSLSPRLELSSPLHSLSPRTELSSPSRHVSPSPERGPSPIRPLSPLQSVSSSCYRSSKARTPPSPLRLQHRTTGYLPWESPSTKTSHAKREKRGTSFGEGPTFPETSWFPSAFRLSVCEGYPGQQAADNIFSHLPMHSQQAKVPYLMISIGGIQMVQAKHRSHPTTPSSPTSPPLEGPSAARFESYWGRTARTQGLRTPGDHWSEPQTAGTSQSGGYVLSTTPTCSKVEMETTDSKQYGSSHSSAHTRRSGTETKERCVRDSRSGASLSPEAPGAACLTGQQQEEEEPPSRSDQEEGGAKKDSARTDHST